MLKVEASCEVGDLIDEIHAKTGKEWGEVEEALSKAGKLPESRKRFLTTKFGPIIKKDGLEWLNEALTAIMAELKLENLYVTEAI